MLLLTLSRRPMPNPITSLAGGLRTHHVSLDCRPSMPMCPKEARTSRMIRVGERTTGNPRRPPWRVPRVSISLFRA